MYVNGMHVPSPEHELSHRALRGVPAMFRRKVGGWMLVLGSWPNVFRNVLVSAQVPGHTKQGVGEGQGPHLHEQDLVRTIRERKTPFWLANKPSTRE